MKDVQFFELFEGIALKDNNFFSSTQLTSNIALHHVQCFLNFVLILFCVWNGYVFFREIAHNNIHISLSQNQWII